MSDEPTSTDSTAEPSGSSATEPQTEDQLPEWARTKLAKANDEAAKYRTRARDAEQSARQKVEQEFSEKLEALEKEKQDVSAELDDTKLRNTKLTIAVESGVPGESVSDFADLLQGEDEASLREHAEKVKGLMGVDGAPKSDPAVDPAQGHGNAMPLNGDPLMEMINNKLGIQ